MVLSATESAQSQLSVLCHIEGSSISRETEPSNADMLSSVMVMNHKKFAQKK